MDESSYKQWWALHVRAVRGEALAQEERDAYDAGLRELHAEEDLAGDLSSLQEVHESVATLDARCDELLERRRELKAEVARLEAALSDDESCRNVT